ARTRSLSGLAAHHEEFLSLTGTSQPQRVYTDMVSANYFEVLGVKPILGRALLPGEEEKPGGTPSVVLSYGLWRSHFGADPSIIGKTIQLNRVLCTVVGVAPREFQGCSTGIRLDLWVSLIHRAEDLRDRDDFWLNAVGRLKPGISRWQAEEELDLQMQRIARQFPDSHRGPNQITLDPLWRSPFGPNVYMYKSLLMLLALAAVLLLLACANVANLLLVRSVGRRREVALRQAMGASRGRLVRQLLVESLLLPLANLPFTLNGHVDHTVLLGTVALSILTVSVFGILPALRASALAPVA